MNKTSRSTRGDEEPMNPKRHCPIVLRTRTRLTPRGKALLLVLAGAATAVFAQSADPPSAASIPPGAVRPVDEKPSSAASLPAPSLYDVMFSSDDRVIDVTPDEWKQPPGQQHGPYDIEAGHRGTEAGDLCSRAMRIVRKLSPRDSRQGARGLDGRLRQRVLVWQLADSTNPRLRTGEYDEVGDFALVREEPHSSLRGQHNTGTDLDILMVYCFVDRGYKLGTLQQDMEPQLVHDIGSYLYANVDYFVDPTEPSAVKKADKKAVKEMSKALMAALLDDIRTKKAPSLVMAKRDLYEEFAKKND
jgi:hypothetical protein